MRKPVSRILVINDEQLVLKEFVKLLNAAAKSLDNPLGITSPASRRRAMHSRRSKRMATSRR
jgi:hypothetical protein